MKKEAKKTTKAKKTNNRPANKDLTVFVFKKDKWIRAKQKDFNAAGLKAKELWEKFANKLSKEKTKGSCKIKVKGKEWVVKFGYGLHEQDLNKKNTKSEKSGKKVEIAPMVLAKNKTGKTYVEASKPNKNQEYKFELVLYKTGYAEGDDYKSLENHFDYICSDMEKFEVWGVKVDEEDDKVVVTGFTNNKNISKYIDVTEWKEIGDWYLRLGTEYDENGKTIKDLYFETKDKIREITKYADVIDIDDTTANMDDDCVYLNESEFSDIIHNDSKLNKILSKNGQTFEEKKYILEAALRYVKGNSDEKQELKDLSKVLEKHEETGNNEVVGNFEIGSGAYDLQWWLKYKGTQIVECVDGEVIITKDISNLTNIFNEKELLKTIKNVYTDVKIPKEITDEDIEKYLETLNYQIPRHIEDYIVKENGSNEDGELTDKEISGLDDDYINFLNEEKKNMVDYFINNGYDENQVEEKVEEYFENNFVA